MSHASQSNRASAYALRALVLSPWLLLMAAAACSPTAAPPPAQAAAAVDPRSDGAENVRLVGFQDLQGRQSLEVKTKSNAANGNWAYVGHSPNDRSHPQASDEGQVDDEPILNPITGKMEWNGTSIIEISDPSNPKLVWHIPNEVRGVNSRTTSRRSRVWAGPSRLSIVRELHSRPGRVRQPGARTSSDSAKCFSNRGSRSAARQSS